jgi:DUF4097 and DUF4098 domain-containing protein YvlB
MKSLTLTIAAAMLILLLPRCASAQTDQGAVKTKTFTVGKGGRLDLSVDGGDVRIVSVDKGEVTVTAFGTEEDDFEDLRMEMRGNAVWVENFSGGGGSNEMRYDVSVPPQFDITVRTTNGMIRIDGPLSGKIVGSTSAGDIQLGNIGGSVEMNTSGGDIRTGAIQGDVNLKTSGGDIKMGTVSGEADINTSGGDIRVESVQKTLWAKTSGGNIYVGDVGGEATLSTSGGNVTVGKVSGSARLSTAGGDIELEAATGDVKAKTAGGNIWLMNIAGTIDARTAGGDVKAELTPSGKGPSRLSTASGEITLTLPENAKATVHASIRVEGRWRSSRSDYKIRADFTAQSTEENKDDREIRATYLLNGGGEPITLETVNADIIIRKALKH